MIRTGAEAFLGKLKATGGLVRVVWDLQYRVDAGAVADPQLVIAYGQQSVQVGTASPMVSQGTAVLRKDSGQWKLAVVTVGIVSEPMQDLRSTEA